MADGLKAGDKIFISFLNDNETKKEGYYTLVDLNDNSVTIKNNGGVVVLIPINRVLKIKRGAY